MLNQFRNAAHIGRDHRQGCRHCGENCGRQSLRKARQDKAVEGTQVGCGLLLKADEVEAFPQAAVSNLAFKVAAAGSVPDQDEAHARMPLRQGVAIPFPG